MADTNLYDLFMAPEDDARMKAQALAQVLSKQRTRGNLAMLTGDRVLAPFGQAQLQQAAQGEQQLAGAGEQRAGGVLRKALQSQSERFQAGEGSKDRALRRSLALMDQQRAEAAAQVAGRKQSLDAEEGLRKELMGNPVTRATQEVAMGFEKVKAAAQNPSAAGDLSLVFGYMKMLDPGSTVRENEYATAENARGVPDGVRNMWNKALEGERLAPDQRQDFLSQARNIFQAQMSRYRPLESSYRGLATGAGADPARVAIPLGLDSGPSAEAAPAANVPTITSDADYQTLPPGAEYLAPDGSRRRKGGG